MLGNIHRAHAEANSICFLHCPLSPCIVALCRKIWLIAKAICALKEKEIPFQASEVLLHLFKSNGKL